MAVTYKYSIFKKGDDLLFAISVIDDGDGALNLDANTLTTSFFSQGKGMYWTGSAWTGGSPTASVLVEASQANFPGLYSYTLTDGYSLLGGTFGLFQINPISSGQTDPAHDFDWGEITMISYDTIFEIQQSMTDGGSNLESLDSNTRIIPDII